MFDLTKHLSGISHANDNNSGWTRDDWIDAMYDRLFKAFDKCEQMIAERFNDK